MGTQRDGHPSARRRHQRWLENLQRTAKGRKMLEEMENKRKATYRNDYDILQENYRFLRENASEKEKEKEKEKKENWEEKLAKNYESHLDRSYGIIDLSKYKKGKMGIRWRTKEEVKKEKGLNICGGKGCENFNEKLRKKQKRSLNLSDDSLSVQTSIYSEENGGEGSEMSFGESLSQFPVKLITFQMPFMYFENGEYKKCHVKLRLCENCGQKLTFSQRNKGNKKKEKEKKREKKKKKKEKKKLKKKKSKSKRKRKKRHKESSESDEGESSEFDSDAEPPRKKSRY